MGILGCAMVRLNFYVHVHTEAFLFARFTVRGLFVFCIWAASGVTGYLSRLFNHPNEMRQAVWVLQQATQGRVGWALLSPSLLAAGPALWLICLPQCEFSTLRNNSRVGADMVVMTRSRFCLSVKDWSIYMALPCVLSICSVHWLWCTKELFSMQFFVKNQSSLPQFIQTSEFCSVFKLLNFWRKNMWQCKRTKVCWGLLYYVYFLKMKMDFYLISWREAKITSQE